VANSTNYVFGPWSPSDFTQQDGSGMMFIDFSVVTGNAVTIAGAIEQDYAGKDYGVAPKQ
jgi:hypothetical protein